MIGILIVDQQAWAGISQGTRNRVFGTVQAAGGAIMLQPGLYKAASDRAGLLKRFGRWLTGAPTEQQQQQVINEYR